MVYPHSAFDSLDLITLQSVSLLLLFVQEEHGISEEACRAPTNRFHNFIKGLTHVIIKKKFYNFIKGLTHVII